MRCVDVIRELTAPTGGQATAAAADHLQQCPHCASWAARDARLDRLWDATRPPALSDEAWERLWATASEAFDRRDQRAPSEAVAARPWRRSATVALSIAQAAAILAGFALLYSLQPPAANPHRLGPIASVTVGPSAAMSAPVISVEQSQTVLIHMDRSVDNDRPTVKDLSTELAQNASPNGVDPYFNMFNNVEAMASVQ